MRREIDKTLRPSWALVRQVLAKGWRLEGGKLTAPSGKWVWCEPVGRDPLQSPEVPTTRHGNVAQEPEVPW